MNATFADELFYITAYLEGDDGGDSWSGTGFVHAVDTDQGTVHCLVSNKHVLSYARNLTIRMLRGDGSGVPVVGSASEITIPDADQFVVGHPDEGVDVAIMPLSPVLQTLADEGTPAYFRAVTPAMCLDAARERELDSIEEVLFVGYPNALFDPENYTPIARRGTTATPIRLNYRGEPAFLVDATVFPGSSGSPVCLYDSGIYRSREGGTVMGSRLMFLGVMAAVHTAQVGGSPATALPAEMAVYMTAPMNLGMVYKYSTVTTCVDLLLESHGLVRVDAQPY
jgi:hypothetical protein